MKTEDLVELGLDKDQIAGVFKIRGQEIEEDKQAKEALEQTKVDLEKANADLKTKVTQLEESSVSVEDLESIKNEKSALESQITELQNQHKEDLNKVYYENALVSNLKEAGARDTKLVMSVLNSEEIKYEDGKLVGLDEQLKTVKETHDYLFKQEDNLKSPQLGTGSKGTGRTKADPFQAKLEKYK